MTDGIWLVVGLLLIVGPLGYGVWWLLFSNTTNPTALRLRNVMLRTNQPAQPTTTHRSRGLKLVVIAGVILFLITLYLVRQSVSNVGWLDYRIVDAFFVLLGTLGVTTLAGILLKLSFQGVIRSLAVAAIVVLSTYGLIFINRPILYFDPDTGKALFMVDPQTGERYKASEMECGNGACFSPKTGTKLRPGTAADLAEEAQLSQMKVLPMPTEAAGPILPRQILARSNDWSPYQPIRKDYCLNWDMGPLIAALHEKTDSGQRVVREIDTTQASAGISFSDNVEGIQFKGKGLDVTVNLYWLLRRTDGTCPPPKEY